MSHAAYWAYGEIMRDERGDYFFCMPGLCYPAGDFVEMCMMGVL